MVICPDIQYEIPCLIEYFILCPFHEPELDGEKNKILPQFYLGNT